MKLLIVDDEELTRTGLIAALNWKALGITEIYQAADGVEGLAVAAEHQPDIVLCDVRMPRMDGITMLERLEAQYPDIAAIFMSGYSDKEYLKAAIKLKAINYIEKPIEPKEIQAAVKLAAEQCSQRLRQRDAEVLHNNITAEQLAYQLTIPYPVCKDTVEAMCAKFQERYSSDKFKSVTTFIVKLQKLPDNPDTLNNIYQTLHDRLLANHLHIIYSEKRIYHIIYHIYGSLAPSESTLSDIAKQFCSLFAPLGAYSLAIGDSVSGIRNAFHSYESAVILLQSSFFFEPGQVLTYSALQNCQKADPAALSSAKEAYLQQLQLGQPSGAEASLASLYRLCYHAAGLMPNQIKALYYDLFTELGLIRRTRQLLPDLSLGNHEQIMDIMDSCFSYTELHTLLCEKTTEFFHDSLHLTQENPTIYLIREYISAHYAEPDLSVKDISDYSHLSTSYVCTFFKAETGITLNQYITQFRMEQAKQLLSDPRYRVNDIASLVGYHDSNYFGKSFRKYTGFSPSEYRDNTAPAANRFQE